jgi:tight adherence protein B
VRVSPAQFVGVSLGVGAAVFVLTFFVTGAVLVAVVPALAAAMLPRTYFGRRRAARLRELQAAWPDGLRDVSASIAAGSSLSVAVAALALTGPAALRDAFARFPQLAHMLGPVAALEVVKAELADPTSDRVIEVLILAQERGGSIVASILADLVIATTKDLKVLEEVESEGLEMKLNARAVLVMPWLVLVALTIREGAFREFYRSPPGVAVVVIGGALSAVGAWWIGRLGRAHGEHRVFGSLHPLEAPA